jgi:hypothetical protein
MSSKNSGLTKCITPAAVMKVPIAIAMPFVVLLELTAAR